MTAESVFWKRKLVALFHDSPTKVLGIKDHAKRAATSARRAGLEEDEILLFVSGADHEAAAADRFPFPAPAILRSGYDGVGNRFRHPLGGPKGASLEFAFGKPFPSREFAEEAEQHSQPDAAWDYSAFTSEDELWRARLFAQWRLWPPRAREQDPRLAFLPADTRIPDHTLWNHVAIVSAFQGTAVNKDGIDCLEPAFLRFKLGGVQDFISAARSTRDLWSGSYLISWLTASGLKALSAILGPDSVIFPALREQPLFDLMWGQELWSKLKLSQESPSSFEDFQNSWGENQADLLIPNLPNTFLALVPARKANEIAGVVAEAIQTEWRSIAASVWEFCEAKGLTRDEGAISEKERRRRFDDQITQTLNLAWHVLPWPDTIEEIKSQAKWLPGQEQTSDLNRLNTIATEKIPKDHRDKRCFRDDSKTTLKSNSFMWPVLDKWSAWELDAIRQTRTFAGYQSSSDTPDLRWHGGTAANKDALTGGNEAVAGGEVWSERAKSLPGKISKYFKHQDWLEAVTLVKRVWHLAYLQTAMGIPYLKMPDTYSIANGDPKGDTSEEGNEKASDASVGYYAILAMDGDEMGKWVSGDKAPLFLSQLSADDSVSEGKPASNAQRYFASFEGTEKMRRPVSPSYHLQFSEALANFALRCVKPIVEAFKGRLIYAGGDDVLAMLPANHAIDCARALRMAFRGSCELAQALSSAPWPDHYLRCDQEGFLTVSSGKQPKAHDPTYIVPGPAADVSAGITFAHPKAPLQDVVRSAHASEKRAKVKHGRSALAITILKRSGEEVHWGCRWDSSAGSDGIALLQECIANALNEKEALSKRFPQRLIELIRPYWGERFEENTAFATEVDSILLREIEYLLSRHFNHSKRSAEGLLSKFAGYLKAIEEEIEKTSYAGNKAESPSQAKVARLAGLAQTLGWLIRHADSNQTESENTGESTTATA